MLMQFNIYRFEVHNCNHTNSEPTVWMNSNGEEEQCVQDFLEQTGISNNVRAVE